MLLNKKFVHRSSSNLSLKKEKYITGVHFSTYRKNPKHRIYKKELITYFAMSRLDILLITPCFIFRSMV